MATPAVKISRPGLLAGRSPLVRFQPDERLIMLIRSGNDAAFEILFDRYRARLLAFCRHMLGSKEDAEDVLQDLFVAAYNAIRADDRELNVRPWLYRIARNRCLNHLRRPTQDGRDTMDDQVHLNGVSTADIVHRRADFRHLLADIQKLPESQRTALLLREIDALSYDQIADAMETTVPSVKSLLVRARMSLAEAAEARKLTCMDVRRELAEVTEGLKKTTPPIRRHLRDCEQCSQYRAELRKTSTAMAMVFPVGLTLLFKKVVLAKLGAAAATGGAAGGGAAAGGTAAAGGATAGGAAAGGAAAGGAAAAGGLAGGAGAATVGVGAVAGKAIAVTAATALIAGGAVEVKKMAAPPTPPARTAAVQHKPVHFQSGGQAAQALPPVAIVKQKLKAAKDEAAAKSEADAAAAPAPADETADAPPVDTPADAGSTGATVPADPNATEPTTGDGAPAAPEDVDPSGGAALPPTQHAPPAANGSQAGTTDPAAVAQ
jgi:RNA polymerase sigma factor (sigma-70 family)